jgi:hypothetical protein
MPAGPVGSVWAAGTWSDTAWEANTWADASPTPPSGQVPAASRYRASYQIRDVIGLLVLLLFG